MKPETLRKKGLCNKCAFMDNCSQPEDKVIRLFISAFTRGFYLGVGRKTKVITKKVKREYNSLKEGLLKEYAQG